MRKALMAGVAAAVLGWPGTAVAEDATKATDGGTGTSDVPTSVQTVVADEGPAQDSETGNETADNGKFPYVVRASDLLGADIRNADGDELGHIEDLVITMDKDRVVRAVVSVGGFLGLGDRLVAVPYEDMRLGRDGALMLNVTRDQLAEMPQFEYRDVFNTAAGYSNRSESIDENRDSETGERDYLAETEAVMSDWTERVEAYLSDGGGGESQFSKDVKDAWADAQKAWQDVKTASGGALDDAKARFDDALENLQTALEREG